MDFDKIIIDGTPYNVKDSAGRTLIEENSSSISAEASNREEQYQQLDNKISTEISDREEAFSQLNQKISANTSAISANTSNISQNTTDIAELKNMVNSELTVFITPTMYGAKGDGSTDDTQAIQNALNAAQLLKVGVYFPAGQFVCGAVTVPAGVAIVGVANFQGSNRSKGTWILPNQTSSPTITLNSGCSIKGFSFYYPGQTFNINPTVYAAAIQVANESRRVLIQDILFFNAYDGINADNHHESLWINNVQGYCIRTCVFAGDCSDVDRFTNIHTNVNMLTENSVANAKSYRTWTRANGVAFRFGQGDWPCFTDMFCWGYRHAFYMEPTNYRGSGYSGMCGAHFVKCGADNCGTCFLTVGISGQSFTNHWGLQFDDCFMVAMNQDNPGQDTQFAVLLQSCDDAVFNNCRVWGTEGTAFCLECDFAELNNCVFWDYGTVNASTNISAVEVHKGSVNMMGCLIRANTKALSGVNIVEQSAGVTVTACTFNGFATNSWMVQANAAPVQLYVCDNILNYCDNSRMYTGQTPTGFGVIDKENVRHMINLTTQDGL